MENEKNLDEIEELSIKEETRAIDRGEFLDLPPPWST
jgi:hypothetical protein